MTDRDLAKLCGSTFDAASEITIWHDPDTSDVTVCLRASKTLRDWAQDFLVLEHNHPALGRIHDGFLAEASAIMPQIAGVCVGRRFILTGHSRGGALALVLGGLLKAQGLVASAIVTFGAPRAGGLPLATYLADVPVRQYRCGGDPIPFWPDAPFCSARPLLQVGDALSNPLKDHEIARYVSEVRDGIETAPQLAG